MANKQRNKRYLAIVPARGGSKGIKDKNIVDINGKPLLYYTAVPVVNAVNLKIIDRAILSTDSEKIAKIGGDLGLEVPFLRPSELADDQSKSIDVIKHAIGFFEKQNIFFDAVVLLQPTCPLRTLQDIQDSITIFENCQADTLISCYADETIHPNIIYEKEKDSSFGSPISNNHSEGARRQDFGPLLIRNGAVYIINIEFMKKENKLISDNPLIYEMPKSRSINIDSEEDLFLVRKIIGD